MLSVLLRIFCAVELIVEPSQRGDAVERHGRLLLLLLLLLLYIVLRASRAVVCLPVEPQSEVNFNDVWMSKMVGTVPSRWTLTTTLLDPTAT